jgi:copper chaperone CopZ
MRTKVLFLSLAVAAVCTAKDIKTVVLNTAPEMHCSSCENKIKSNLKFEKGIKDIQTDLTSKTVTIQYDADKTNVENIIAGFKKINYVATVADDKSTAEAAPKAEKKGGCCGSGGCKCGSAKKEDQAEAKPAENKGCRCGSKKAAPETASVEGAIVKFKASQMSCGGCANKVKKLLSGINGVNDVAVNLETKVVTVNYDDQKTDVEKIRDSFKQINYTVEDVQ